MAGAKLACALILCMMVFAPVLEVQAAITCPAVTKYLAPCVGYLRNGGRVPGTCCAGVSALNNAAKSTPDRRAACNCIKTAAGQVGAKPSFASALPGICKVNVGYPISNSVDCSKVR